MKNKRAIKSKFIPKNPRKYIGNPNNIVLRSNWERQFAMFLDRDTRVVKWCSEEISVFYKSPLDRETTQILSRFSCDHGTER